jgi:hypothetical protein
MRISDSETEIASARVRLEARHCNISEYTPYYTSCKLSCYINPILKIFQARCLYL